MQEVNFNFNNIVNMNGPGFSAPINPTSNMNRMLADLFGSMSYLFNSFAGSSIAQGGCVPQGGCTSPPVMEDCRHPSGSLKADGNKVTTPGGYTIEPMGKFEWKITGPDGKSTRVWGDPHVAESDGGKWDFKRNSTFMLPDGTRINVNTKPWSNGTTVTGSLEIINGNDRVMISDIDKGKGRIGTVTQDGFAHANSFTGNDVFVMGRETDDWSFRGREILGSRNGGESFSLGNQLAPGTNHAHGNGNNIMDFLSRLFGNWDPNWRPNDFGSNPYYNPIFGNIGNGSQYNCGNHQNSMSEMFGALSDMFDAISRLTDMNQAVFANRSRSLIA
ncbi:MAG: DUF1521 domain-containing protein [Pyrinomonadaceae bacterium]|nr:DUF1521 domain-containing protein [Pyrinomonadaceae bacterium]